MASTAPATGTSSAVPVERSRTSTCRRRSAPTTTTVGMPSSSASLNFTPGTPCGRRRTSTPAASSCRYRILGPGDRRLVLVGDHDVHVERCDLTRPAQALVVVALLGDHRDQTRHTDTVGAHRHTNRFAVLAEYVELKGIGVLAPELEDVTDLDALGRDGTPAPSEQGRPRGPRPPRSCRPG